MVRRLLGLVAAVLLVAGLVLAASPAQGAPPGAGAASGPSEQAAVLRAGPGFRVERLPAAAGQRAAGGVDAVRVTVTGGPFPVRSARAVITADGVPLAGGAWAAAGGAGAGAGAVLAADLRSASVVTSDVARALAARAFTLGWGSPPRTSPGPPSPEAGPAPAPGTTPAPRAPAAAPGPAAAAAAVPTLPVDPGASGPYAVRRAEFDLGDRAAPLSALPGPVEFAGSVHYSDAPGPRPLVLLLHGRHVTCYSGSRVALAWPCPAPMVPVPSHRGYDYAAHVLASHGYVVASISANGVNAADDRVADLGALARAQLVLRHLDRWRTWSTSGGAPFGNRFVDRVDLSSVGLMGHSRGGEGVVRAGLLNAARPSPYGVRAVLPLASTDFARHVLPQVAMATVLPYCDGDVTDLQGQHLYDDARYAVSGDRAPRAAALVLGANHNYFNTQWTPGTAEAPASDDWLYTGRPSDPTCGPNADPRLSAAQQRAVGRAYLAGFFRLHLGGEQSLSGLYDGSGARAASAGRADVRVVAQVPAPVRRELLDLATTRTLPYGVRASGLEAHVCAGLSPEPRPCASELTPLQAPHWTPSFLVGSAPTTRALRLAWTSAGGQVRVSVPGSARDLRRYSHLTLRAGVNPLRSGAADLVVSVADGSGRQASVVVSSLSRALEPLPGPASFLLPKVVFGAVRVPLAQLTGVNLADVRTVSFAPRSASGTVFLTDLTASRPALGVSAPTRLPRLRVADVTVVEGSGTRYASVPLTASRASDAPVSVYVATTDGSAVSGVDFSAVSRRVTLPAGSTRVVVRVPLVADETDDEDERTLGVALSLPREAVVERGQAVVSVLDDDPEPTVQAGDGRGVEAPEGVLAYPLRLSAPTGRYVLLSGVRAGGTATAGQDYFDFGRFFGGVNPGELSGEITVPLADDAVPEPVETLRLSLSDGEGAALIAPFQVTGALVDDD